MCEFALGQLCTRTTLLRMQVAIADYSKWLIEGLTDGQVNMVAIESVSFSGKSPFQTLDVMTLVPFGRALVLDDKIQSSECCVVCVCVCAAIPISFSLLSLSYTPANVCISR